MDTSADSDKAVQRTEHGMLLLGMLSALFLGPLTGVPGLIWARRLRPFSEKVRIARALCLYGCFVSWTACTLIFQSYHAASYLEVGVVLACNLAWLAVCRRFLPRPARTVGGALLIAVIGTLIIAPVVFPFYVPVTLPLAVLPVIAIRDGAWQLVLLLAAVPVLFVLPAHLALYWPSQPQAHTGEGGSIAKPSKEFCRVVSYLVAAVFWAWLASMTGAPGHGIHLVAPWLDLFWLLAMPIVSAAYAFAGMFNPSPDAPFAGQVLSLLLLCTSFYATFGISMWVTSRRMPGLARFFMQARGAE